MYKHRLRPSIAISIIAASGIWFSTSFAELSQEFIDQTNASIDTLRKRECQLTVKHLDQLLKEKEISIRQVRNHFGFGAATAWWPFKKETVDRATYAELFLKYFEWATPENEMKWAYINEVEDYSNYDDADSLITWCAANDVKVRGHSLFWNEDEKWIPSWATELDTARFKAAMTRRINGTVDHFKGRLAHWDLINEIVHTLQHTVEIPGMLARRSGDPDVFAWIFKQARAIDSSAKMCVNEYNVIEAASDANAYINEIKSIESKGAKIDIVGLEGHFTTIMEHDHYSERIDTIINSLPEKEFWLTEVDFQIDTLLRADKTEELMRTCFARPRIGGIILWVWWEGNRWGSHTSFLVDSNFTENELGARWRSVRDEWKTNKAGSTTADGRFDFKGFHGKYVVSVHIEDSTYFDTFYLEPGAGPQPIEINFEFGTGVAEKWNHAFETVSFRLNGRQMRVNLPVDKKQPLFLSTYTLSGRLLSRTPFLIKKGSVIQTNAPSGCHLFRIETTEKVFYTGRGMVLR